MCQAEQGGHQRDDLLLAISPSILPADEVAFERSAAADGMGFAMGADDAGLGLVTC